MSDSRTGEGGAAAEAVEEQRQAQKTAPDLVIDTEDDERQWEPMEEEESLGKHDGSIHDFEAIEEDSDDESVMNFRRMSWRIIKRCKTADFRHMFQTH